MNGSKPTLTYTDMPILVSIVLKKYPRTYIG